MRQGEETATFSVVDGNFKLEVKSNKVKSFDERADLAAERLIDYLKNYIAHSEKGVDDPMYQMAMTLLERNRQGDLDYKSISKLYELESRFDIRVPVSEFGRDDWNTANKIVEGVTELRNA